MDLTLFFVHGCTTERISQNRHQNLQNSLKMEPKSSKNGAKILKDRLLRPPGEHLAKKPVRRPLQDAPWTPQGRPQGSPNPPKILPKSIKIRIKNLTKNYLLF